MEETGLLIAGKLYGVPGVRVLAPAGAGGPTWCALSPGDYRMRRGAAHQVVLHTTKGDWPQHVIPGAGLGGRARLTADFWRNDPSSSAAHIVIDSDGTVACLADLAYACAYHATVSNEYSVGIELYQEPGGGIYEAVYSAAVPVVRTICSALGIPFQFVADPYTGHPLQRFLDGARDFYGVLGHRHNTEQRGRGDPGDEIFARLLAAGAEPVIAAHRQDIALGKARQAWLNTADERARLAQPSNVGWIPTTPLVVDGIVGPASLAAARRQGYRSWREVPA
jgi:hypothetical protein